MSVLPEETRLPPANNAKRRPGTTDEANPAPPPSIARPGPKMLRTRQNPSKSDKIRQNARKQCCNRLPPAIRQTCLFVRPNMPEHPRKKRYRGTLGDIYPPRASNADRARATGAPPRPAFGSRAEQIYAQLGPTSRHRTCTSTVKQMAVNDNQERPHIREEKSENRRHWPTLVDFCHPESTQSARPRARRRARRLSRPPRPLEQNDAL